MSHTIIAAGLVGLWFGLVAVLAGQLTIVDVGSSGYVAGLVGGIGLAYGIGRLVKKGR